MVYDVLYIYLEYLVCNSFLNALFLLCIDFSFFFSAAKSLTYENERTRKYKVKMPSTTFKSNSSFMFCLSRYCIATDNVDTSHKSVYHRMIINMVLILSRCKIMEYSFGFE